MSTLVTTGVLMGILHVLTGTDHLAAVATLSAANLTHCPHIGLDGLLVGFLWGLGHSLGILVVGFALLAAGREDAGDDNLGVDDTVGAAGARGHIPAGPGGWGLQWARKNLDAEAGGLSRQKTLVNLIKMSYSFLRTLFYIDCIQCEVVCILF